jgi:hypothetical protein
VDLINDKELWVDYPPASARLQRGALIDSLFTFRSISIFTMPVFFPKSFQPIFEYNPGFLVPGEQLCGANHFILDG